MAFASSVTRISFRRCCTLLTALTAVRVAAGLAGLVANADGDRTDAAWLFIRPLLTIGLPNVGASCPLTDGLLSVGLAKRKWRGCQYHT